MCKKIIRQTKEIVYQNANRGYVQVVYGDFSSPFFFLLLKLVEW